MSLNIKIQDGSHLPIPFFLFWAIWPILLAEFHIRNSFSAICVYFLVSFLVFWRAQTSKFKIAASGHTENVLHKKMVLETGVIPLFLSNVSHWAHFWNNFVFWQVWLSKFKMVTLCHFLVFRFKPSDPLFLLNVTSETRFKQYLLIL